MNLRIVALFCLTSMLLLNCKKEAGKKEGTLLKSILSTSPYQNYKVDSFLYDQQKRLTGIQHINSTSDYDSEVGYNPEGRLSKVTYWYQGVKKFDCIFEYNEKGQIIKKLVTPFTGAGVMGNESYAYDNNGRLVADTTYNQQSGAVNYYSAYTYDSKGNIIEDDFRDFMSPQNSGKTVHTFDDHANPFHLQGPMYFYVTGNPSYLSNNNVVETKPWWSNSLTTQYEYQVNGLPKKFIITDPNGPSGPYRATVVAEYW